MGPPPGLLNGRDLSLLGPFGRNLHEGLMGVSGQGRSIGRGQTWILHGREEQNKIHDEVGMRHYYAEWSRRMGRRSSDPDTKP
jgi:methanesulfonate monooxygenase subunit alpha